MSVPSCSSLQQEPVSSIAAHYRPKKRRLQPAEDVDGPPTLTIEYPQDGYSSNEESKLRKTKKVVKTARQATLQASLIVCDTSHDIKMRLLRYHCPCDVNTLNCEYPMCGRSFSSIEVLAFHVSYAHHDVSRPMAATICFVCGNNMESAKGKISHLTCRHKTLSAEHNEQCMAQRCSNVISPHAPAAIRLEENVRQKSSGTNISANHSEYNASPSSDSLSEICDMVVIPHEEEEEEVI